MEESRETRGEREEAKSRNLKRLGSSVRLSGKPLVNIAGILIDCFAIPVIFFTLLIHRERENHP